MKKIAFRVFTAILGVQLCLASPVAAQQRTGTVDFERMGREAVEKLREYLRVETLNPPGHETRGVEWLRRVFDAEGIAYEYGESAPGRGNLVARLKGKGSAPALVLLHHIDVVPVNREYWTTEPFSGAVKDGYIYGRGAQDMKSLAIAELMAFLTLHRAKVPLDRDVIFLATADEEAGGEFGAGWVVKNRPQWIAGAGFLLNEGARSPVRDDGSPRFIGVGRTEKTPAWLKLVATGTPGHGSVPRPDSAVNRLIAGLERLRSWQTPLEVTPPIAAAFASQAAFVEEPWRTRFRDIAALVKTPGAREALAQRPEALALVTNTVSITGLEGTNKINIIPPVATALVDCRLLPGWTIERWVAEIKRVLADDSIKIEVVLNFPPTVSPAESPLYRTIEEAVKGLHPGASVAQTVTAGFTDSHFFRERGIVSYGFAPFAITEADSGTAHGNDERMKVSSFTAGVKLMWEVVYRFVRAE